MGCKWEEWKIVDNFDNKDFVCTHPDIYTPGYTTRCCYGNETCKYYEPDRDCNTCAHHKEEIRNGIQFVSCDAWECEYKSREEEKK